MDVATELTVIETMVSSKIEPQKAQNDVEIK